MLNNVRLAGVAVILCALGAPALADYGPRPAKWCGYWLRTQMRSDPGPAFNRAIEWKRYGLPARGPSLGVIVVWRHHVGKITGHDGNGLRIVKSGNDGGAVRERPRPVKN